MPGAHLEITQPNEEKEHYALVPRLCLKTSELAARPHDLASSFRDRTMAAPLDREEYVEQAYFFRTLGERMLDNHSTQETANGRS